MFQGEPLDQGSIHFSPLEDGPGISSGSEVRNSHFEMTEQRGLPPGVYRIRIHSGDPNSVEPEPEFPGEHQREHVERIPAEFNSHSDKTVTVTKEGPNRFQFDIP